GLLDVHPLDQPLTDRVEVDHAPLAEEVPVLVADDLVDLDSDASLARRGDLRGPDVRVAACELALPVGADRLVPAGSPALPGVRPVYVGMHQRDGRVDVAGVERVVRAAQELFVLGAHRPSMDRSATSL